MKRESHGKATHARALAVTDSIRKSAIAFGSAGLLISSISSCCFEEEPKKEPKAGEWQVLNTPQAPQNKSENTKSGPLGGISVSGPSSAVSTKPDPSGSAPGLSATITPDKTPDNIQQTAPKDVSELMKGDKGCLEGMARIGRFCMDRWESELIGKSDKKPYPFYQVPPADMNDLMAHTAPGIYPQGYMNGEMAEKACGNASKRLCSLEEWKLACNNGDPARRYPYGPKFIDGKCNVNKTNPHVLDLFYWDTPHKLRNKESFWINPCLDKISLDLPADDECMVRISQSPNLVRSPDGGLALRYWEKTGVFNECVSPHGIYDMEGNGSEWLSDTKAVPGDSVIHGYFAGNPVSSHYKDGCEHHTSAHWRTWKDYSLTVRCCTDAK